MQCLLHQFQGSVSDKHVLVLTDNITAKAHINRQEGTRSKSLILEAKRLGLWAERHLQSLTAEHISGASNVQAGWLSRTAIDHSEWCLHLSLFKDLIAHFGIPEVDMFANQQNAQLRLFSRFPTLRAEGVDVLLSPWPQELLYAFPPLSLLPRLVRKILEERAEVILLAPHWEALVQIPQSIVRGSTLEDPSGCSFAQPGGVGSPGSTVAPTDSLALELHALKWGQFFLQGYPDYSGF